MSRHRLLPYRAAGLALAFAFAGCAAEGAASPELSEQESALSPLPLPPQLQVRALQDPKVIDTLGDAERTLFVGSNAEYRTAFGHDAPSDVQFAAGDKVLLFSAGLEPTDGYRAYFGAVTFHDARTLSVQPQLDAPGESCVEAENITHPYALGIVRAPLARGALFAPTVATEVDCPSCADVSCDPGSHCAIVPVQCVRAPCPDQPECVADSCADLRCRPGTHCELVKIECVKQPCPPLLLECKPDDTGGEACGTHPPCGSWARCVGTGDNARCIPLPITLDAPTE